MVRSYILDPPKPSVDRPQCPECGWLMWLDRIEPDEPNGDRRTFECPRCQHVEIVTEEVRVG
jgi:predicted RNA-binding Zn-ribbon protein involved in translation (DUF1610 family)